MVARTESDQESFTGLCLSGRRSLKWWSESCLRDATEALSECFFIPRSYPEQRAATRDRDALAASVRFGKEGGRTTFANLLERAQSYKRYSEAIVKGVRKCPSDDQTDTGTNNIETSFLREAPRIPALWREVCNNHVQMAVVKINGSRFGELQTRTSVVMILARDWKRFEPFVQRACIYTIGTFGAELSKRLRGFISRLPPGLS